MFGKRYSVCGKRGKRVSERVELDGSDFIFLTNAEYRFPLAAFIG